MNIKNNINILQQSLPKACKLVAVSKTKPSEMILEAYAAGQRLFGENKVQELEIKHEQLPKDIVWHMIGHLQSNKIKYIAPFVSLIHSVDSIKLLAEINKQGVKVNRVIPCLLQVHIAEEETKFGFSEAELLEVVRMEVEGLNKLTNIKIVGLMGMATFTENTDQIRREFRGLRTLFDRLKAQTLPSNIIMQELSMGMSGDYKIAVEEGSTLIRVGSAIFGDRLAASL